MLSFKTPRTIYFHFYFTSRARNSFLFFSSGKWSICPGQYYLQMEDEEKKEDIVVYFLPIHMCVRPMCVRPMPMFKFLLCLPHQVYFGMLDALLASEELPEEYRDRCQVKHLDFILSSNSDQAIIIC
jgi:hypothetical protein